MPDRDGRIPYPTQEQWAGLDPVGRFELSTRLLIDARRFRVAKTETLTTGESDALELLTSSLREMGYEPAYPSHFKWRRTT